MSEQEGALRFRQRRRSIQTALSSMQARRKGMPLYARYAGNRQEETNYRSTQRRFRNLWPPNAPNKHLYDSFSTYTDECARSA